MNLVDLALGAVLLLGFLWGYRVGFFRMLVGLAGYLISFWFAGLLAPTVVSQLDERFHFTQRVSEGLAKQVPLPEAAHQLTMTDVPFSDLGRWVDALPLPPFYRQLVTQGASLPAVEPGQTAAAYIYTHLAHTLLQTATFIVLLVLLALLLQFAARLLTGVFDHLPLVGGLNRLAGGLGTLFQVGLLAGLLLTLVSPLTALPSWQWLAEPLATSKLAAWLSQGLTWLLGLVFRGWGQLAGLEVSA